MAKMVNSIVHDGARRLFEGQRALKPSKPKTFRERVRTLLGRAPATTNDVTDPRHQKDGGTPAFSQILLVN